MLYLNKKIFAENPIPIAQLIVGKKTDVSNVLPLSSKQQASLDSCITVVSFYMRERILVIPSEP